VVPAENPTEVIRGERYELIRGKHYEVDIEYDEEYVIIAIAPIWDSARRHTLDMVIRRDRLREELDERLRDLLHVLAKARKAIERKVGSANA
jgi:DNA-binding IclR family transcriptional regulator